MTSGRPPTCIRWAPCSTASSPAIRRSRPRHRSRPSGRSSPGAGVAPAAQRNRQPRSGNHLPQVLAEGTGEALRDCHRARRGPSAVACRRADPGPPGRECRTDLALVPAESQRGRARGRVRALDGAGHLDDVVLLVSSPARGQRRSIERSRGSRGQGAGASAVVRIGHRPRPAGPGRGTGRGRAGPARDIPPPSSRRVGPAGFRVVLPRASLPPGATHPLRPRRARLRRRVQP